MNSCHVDKITAIIVTYNRLEKLQVSIEKILNEPIHAVIVVNNNSSDGTLEWLDQQDDSRLTCLHLDENTGGSGGFFNGIKYVNENIETDWILLFDDDAYPDQGLLNTFSVIEKNGMDIIATKVLNPCTKTPIKMNRPARIIPKTTFELIQSFFKPNIYACNISNKESLQPVEIEACSFVGCFIRTEAVKSGIGLPDPSLFIYCDDLIYTYGAKKKGLRLYYFPSLVFFHDCEINNKRIYESPWKAYYLAKNYVIFYNQVNNRQFILMSLIRIFYLSAHAFSCSRPFEYLYQIINGAIAGIKITSKNKF